MAKKFSHIDAGGNPQMVNVSHKETTLRTARARAEVVLGNAILKLMKGTEVITKKGPVFQTATIAGVMAAKRTHELIPFCHPIGLADCQISIKVKKKTAVIDSSCTVVSRTGVEMEALTAATVAALTIYDMCKAVSHHIEIKSVKLMEKTGGKKDFKRKK